MWTVRMIAFHDADVGHAGDAAFLADIRRHALERHYRASPGVFGNLSLLGVGDVHDDATLEHLGQADLQSNCSLEKSNIVISLKIQEI